MNATNTGPKISRGDPEPSDARLPTPQRGSQINFFGGHGRR
eukprot:CAMPEP_0205824392 /NCGR_PEP_ID=MMETSP0206-20130828/20760_1 /ASSEMBLY_ACC=CAM_ASM_000279 /TAXON_ID=36767 /ORGANISM="Euplotes focardii, Strain TN1" /LENGTH=40 /DNA_ID= /DNA_START= /DNA_END= /DNA_ORIENTATION=